MNHERKKRINGAIRAIRRNKMKFSHAAEIYKVPKSTLHDHISGNCKKFTKGRLCIFTKAEEQHFVRIFKEMLDRGYKLTPMHCRKSAFHYAKLCGYKHNFNEEEGMAGRKWFDGFVKRNRVTYLRRNSSEPKIKLVMSSSKNEVTIEESKPSAA